MGNAGGTSPESAVATALLHPLADVQSKHIGDGTRVWQFCVVLPGARLGANCNVNSHVFIENDVTIGDNVTIKSGVQVWDGTTIGSDVFIGPNVTFTNDRFPRSKRRPAKFLRTVVEPGASIGANATILPGLTIGSHAMIGAGAVVTRSVPPFAIVIGNPAAIIGYAGAQSSAGDESTDPLRLDVAEVGPVSVGGVAVHALPRFRDMRGSLSVAEFDDTFPFAPRRCFIVHGVPSRETRGEHAHRECDQFLICVRGSVAVVVDDARRRSEIVLDDPGRGLYLPAMTWGIQYKFSADATLLVFASHPYDPADYIRDYDAFVRLALGDATS